MLWHRQVSFESKGDKLSFLAECQGSQDTKSPADCMPPDKPTWAIEDQAKKLELDSPSLWSASIEPIRPHYLLAFAPGSCDLHVCCCKFRWLGTDKRFSNRKKRSCLPFLNAGFEPRVSDTKSPADWMPADKPTELSRMKLKKCWTRQPVPMISDRWAHSTPLLVGFRTWLWRYENSFRIITEYTHYLTVTCA